MTTRKRGKVRFSKAFWVADTVELFEQTAYYDVFTVITLYLSRILGPSDIQAAGIAGIFSTHLYLLPTFVGTSADKIGFRNSMLLVLALLICGYLGLTAYPTWFRSAGLVEHSATITFTGSLESNLQYGIIPTMVLIICGGIFIKSVTSDMAAKETTPETRAKGFSILYAMINTGAFSGKTIMKSLHEMLGNEGLITLNYFSMSMTFLTLLAIWFFYESTQYLDEGKTFGQTWSVLIKVRSNGQLITLIIIITGFWTIQYQLYAAVPKCVLRSTGEGASPSWYANVDPLVVVLTVDLVAQMMRKRTALTSMTVGTFIMPVSTLCVASGSMLDIDPLVLGMYPVTFMMVVDTVFQGLAETFISPRFFKYLSLQTPKEEEGLYLGFSQLHFSLSSIFGFGLSGFLSSKYCPESVLFTSHEEWLAVSANAHYIWYYFDAITPIFAAVLIVYGQAVKGLDSQKI